MKLVLLLLLALSLILGGVLVGAANNTQMTLTITVNHTAVLTWTASTDPNVSGYNVYRGSVSGGPYTKLNSNPFNALDYNDVTVVSGHTYFYVVTAISSAGESNNSNEVTGAVQ